MVNLIRVGAVALERIHRASLKFSPYRFKFVTNFRQPASGSNVGRGHSLKVLLMKSDDFRSIKLALQHPTAYHRILANIGGGVTAGLFLSQCWYWTTKTTDQDGWLSKTQAEWEKETGLTRREQETARKRLRSRGFLQEKRAGVPARLYFRLDVKALAAAIRRSTDAPVQSSESAIPGWPIPPNKNVQSSLFEWNE